MTMQLNVKWLWEIRINNTEVERIIKTNRKVWRRDLDEWAEAGRPIDLDDFIIILNNYKKYFI